MFLNDVGQPNLELARIMEHSPCLLTDSLGIGNIPSKWSGTLYTTRDIVAQINYHELPKDMEIHELTPNVSNTVTLPGSGPEDANQIELTAIPMSVKWPYKVIFLIEDEFVTVLATGALSDCFDAFVSNTKLHKAIEAGIDVLYIDDTVFMDNVPPDEQIAATEWQLRALVYLVCPKNVVGLKGAELPSYIKELCRSHDFFYKGAKAAEATITD